MSDKQEIKWFSQGDKQEVVIRFRSGGWETCELSEEEMKTLRHLFVPSRGVVPLSLTFTNTEGEECTFFTDTVAGFHVKR